MTTQIMRLFNHLEHDPEKWEPVSDKIMLDQKEATSLIQHHRIRL